MLASLDTEEVDEGLAAARKGLERLCLATRAVTPVEQMIRYVVDPSGRVVPDLERKLPGRGGWVTATRAALEIAIKEKALARAFRGKGAVGPELADLVERLLEKAAIDALSLANKAGQVITGFTKIEAALAGREIAVVLNASDAAADGIRKLDRATADRPRPARIGTFRGEQLDLALGRPNVVHAALLVHPASTGFLARCQRLDHWRNSGPAGETGVSSGASGR
ncbi:MAG: RNA-binding protein [Xanthobacteraceae bacterium]